MDAEVVIIKKDLPTTALNAKHPRALEMKKNVEEIATAEGGSVSDFSVSKGDASFRVTGKGVAEKIAAIYKELPEVEVEILSVVAANHLRNKAAQKRADEMKATKEAKKEKEGKK